jgi:gliding motility-associated-like protein
MKADEKTVTYTWKENATPVIAVSSYTSDRGCNPSRPSQSEVEALFTVTDNCNTGVASAVVTANAIVQTDCNFSQTWRANYTSPVCSMVADEKTVTYTWKESTTPTITVATNGSRDYNCVTIAPTDTPTFTVADNCNNQATVNLDYTDSDNGCEYTRTWTATYTNGCGTSATPVEVIYTWKIADKPEITVRNNNTHDYGCTEPTGITPEFDVTDNCDPTATVTNIVKMPLQTLDGCVYSQSWIANYISACGVKADPIIVTYTWKDNPKPEISIAFNGDKDYGCIDIAPVDVPYFEVSDNCDWGAAVTDYSNVESHTGCEYTRVWTANYENGCGIKADPVSVTYTWTIRNKPEITVNNNDSQDFGCVVPTVEPEFNVSDSCDPTATVTEISKSQAESTDGCTYTQSWTASYTSSCGIQADPVVVTYTWKDNTKPEISLVFNGDKDYGCIDIAPVDVPYFEVSDNCDWEAAVTDYSNVESHTGCEYTRVWTANYENGCGIKADPVSVTYTWTIRNKPVIEVVNGSQDFGCTEPTVEPEFTVTDNCDPTATVTNIVKNPVQTLDGCVYSQSWIANYISACGVKAAPVMVTYTWKDNTKPEISLAFNGDKDYGCVDIAPVDVPYFEVSDNCDWGAAVTDYSNVESHTGCEYTRVWTANYENGCGIKADPVSVTYTWTIRNKPVIEVVNGSQDFGCTVPTVTPEFSVMNDCGSSVPVSVTDVVEGSVTTLDNCTYSRTWTANYKNACGVIADPVVVTYTWRVNTQPVITVISHGNKDYGCVNNKPNDKPEFKVSDNCDLGALIDLTSEESNNGCQYTKVWTATYINACGVAADPVTVIYEWKQNDKPVITVTNNDSHDYGCVTTPPEDVPVFEVSDQCDSSAEVEITEGEIQNLNDCNYSKTWTANYLNSCGILAETVVVTYTWTLDIKHELSSSGDRDFGNVLEAPTTSPTFTLLHCSGLTTVTDITEGAVQTDDGIAHSKTWTANHTNTCGTQSDPLTVTHTWRVFGAPVISSSGDMDFGCVTEAPLEVPKFTVADVCNPNAIVIDIQEGPIQTMDDCTFSKTWTANYRSNCGTAETVKVTYNWTLDVKPLITATGNKYFHKVEKEPTEKPVFLVVDNCNWLSQAEIEEGELQTVNAYTFIKTWTANYTNACGTSADQIVTMYKWTLASGGLIIPPYFTPNGDGINDTWEIERLKELYPDATVTIYDRFGKKLLTYRGEELGWDGYYDGKAMRATDYWFTILHDDLPDREISGHVTLLR